MKNLFFRKAISEKRREVKEQDNPDALKVKTNTIKNCFLSQSETHTTNCGVKILRLSNLICI